jgi:hypothetical protein
MNLLHLSFALVRDSQIVSDAIRQLLCGSHLVIRRRVQWVQCHRVATADRAGQSHPKRVVGQNSIFGIRR